MRRPGRDDVVVGPLLLQHEPHSLDVLRRPAPVAVYLQIPHRQPLAIAAGDGAGRGDDLARHKTAVTRTRPRRPKRAPVTRLTVRRPRTALRPPARPPRH